MRSLSAFLHAHSFVRGLCILLVLAQISTALIWTNAPSARAASTPVEYQPPSDAEIVDRFRPPPKPWMAGNRGIDYGTSAGAQVGASADGRVIFAGEVGGALHVTIEHADGLRTSSSFLASLTVAAGDQVRAGDVIGIAGGPFHFGVRAQDDTYLDPEALLAGLLQPRARLVPGTDQGLESLGARERRTLLDVFLDTGAAALSVTSAWTSQTTALVAHYLIELNPTTHALRTVDAFAKWLHDQETCTPPETQVPVRQSRRIVVLVSGLGTSSDANTAWEVDTKSLGYADGDVVRYSYQGGQAPRVDADQSDNLRTVSSHPLHAIATRPFDSLDSQQSVGTSADRLSALLQSVAAAQPGMPIDVVAHSQGGVVARLAVQRSGATGRLPSEVDTLVTLSSPQQGAPLATGVVALGESPGGAAALSRVRAAGAADELTNHLPAISDLAETSPIIDELHQRPMPEGVRFVTIGGSGDLVVPGSAAIDQTADASIILPTDIGKEAHGTLASNPAATREIGLAVAGLGPTCQGLGPATKAFVTAETIRYGQTVAAASTAVAAGVLPIPPDD